MVLLFDVGTSGITIIIDISIYFNAMHDFSILANSLYYLDNMFGFQACVPEDYPAFHDDVIKWKHFPRYRPFVHKGQWRGSLMLSLTCAWINDWVNNHKAGDLRRHRCHYDVIVMSTCSCCTVLFQQYFFEFVSCNVFLMIGWIFFRNGTNIYSKLYSV